MSRGALSCARLRQSGVTWKRAEPLCKVCGKGTAETKMATRDAGRNKRRCGCTESMADVTRTDYQRCESGRLKHEHNYSGKDGLQLLANRQDRHRMCEMWAASQFVAVSQWPS